MVINECLTIITRYRLEEKVEVRVLKRIPKEPRYQVEVIDEYLKGKKEPAIRQIILENYPEFSPNLPAQLNVTLAKSYLSNQVDSLGIDAFEMQERALPSGISSSISALLPETIYIPAVKNLSDDLKTTQSTSFGRLLGLLLEDMSPDLEEINASLGQLKKLFNRVLADGELVDLRHDKVKGLEDLVESFLSQSFPKIKIELRIPPPELKTILNTAQIFVDDGTLKWTPQSRQY